MKILLVMLGGSLGALSRDGVSLLAVKLFGIKFPWGTLKEGKYDLILVGHSGLSGVWAAFWGTTAEKVNRRAPCSILIVR